MVKTYFTLALLLLLIACKQDQKPTHLTPLVVKSVKLDVNKRLDLISFGSCNRHDEPQRLWKSIAEEEPDLWVWSGDIIYGDTKDMSAFAQKYNNQKRQPAYQRFLERVPILGIWDDHDFGANNAGKEYVKKKESRDLLFEFLDLPKTDPAWSREGAYQSHIVGPADEQVKVILLDCRYFRDHPIRDSNGYVPAPGDILGEAQWKWFEEELMNSTAALNIVVSGIQVIPEDHKYEKWANFPLSRDRLFNLISSSNSNCVLISGDRHIGEISKLALANGRDIYEITSSGMTHSWDEFPGEENSHRIGKVVSSVNYGSLSINWDSSPAVLTGEIKAAGGVTREIIKIPLSN